MKDKLLIWFRNKINHYFAKKMWSEFRLSPKNESLCGYELIGNTVSIDMAPYYRNKMNEDDYIMLCAEINAKYHYTGLHLD